jgi:putative ABC transport system permease protein
VRKGFYWKLAAGNIRKNRKIYYPYLLTAILTAMMLYVISSLSSNQSLGSGSLLITLQLGKLVTTLFAVIFLFYTNSFLMKRRKKEFGLLNILGMGKKHIGLVIFCETLILLLISLAVGIGLGILFDKLMFLLLMKLLGTGVSELSFQILPGVIVSTALIISAVFLLILLNSIRQIQLANPIELLRGGEVGEREPKANWVLALLGLIFLVAGYYISIAVTDAVTSILLFFVAVVCVILGTYLLFTAGSVTLLKLLRKNKRFYYGKPAHFINVSGMIYRMKQNAVGLANMAILSTMVLVMIFSTFSLWFGMDDTLRSHCPTQMVFEIVDFKSETPLNRETVVNCLNQAVREEKAAIADEMDYYTISFAGYKQGNVYLTNPDAENLSDLATDGLSMLRLMAADDFARLTGEQADLTEDEMWLVDGSFPHSEDDMFLFDRHYRITRRFAADDVFIPSDSLYIYPVRWFIVKDRAVLDQIIQAQLTAYGRNASNPALCLFVNLTTSDNETIQRCFHHIIEKLLTEAEGTITFHRTENQVTLRQELSELYGGLMFVGLFLGSLFIMAMILIIYYKQISEGYEDRERFRIMRQVGLSKAEIRRCIHSQILMVFFLPLLTALIHTCFSFPSVTHMFAALSMQNIPLMLRCMGISFVVFALLYAVVYLLTAREYEKIVA